MIAEAFCPCGFFTWAKGFCRIHALKSVEAVMAKKQKRKRGKSAVLAVVREPVFRMRVEKKEKGRGSYDRTRFKSRNEDYQRKIAA